MQTNKLLPWIDASKLDHYQLLKNRNARGYSNLHIPQYGTPESKRYWGARSRYANKEDIKIFESVVDDLEWWSLSSNPDAASLIMKYPYMVYWEIVCNSNPSSVIINFLRENTEFIYWGKLCYNTSPEAVKLIEDKIDENFNEIDWTALSFNPAAINLLEKHPDRIDWNALSLNPAAIDLLKNNQQNINWRLLSRNTAAIDLLKKNPDKIDWKEFCQNRSPDAIKLIDEKFGDNHWSLYYELDWYYSLCENPSAMWFVEKHLDNGNINVDSMCWERLSRNPEAMGILKKYYHKIQWKYFSKNPAIFTYDYAERAKVFEPLRTEILYSSVSPMRIARGLKALGLKPNDPVPENVYKALGFPYD